MLKTKKSTGHKGIFVGFYVSKGKNKILTRVKKEKIYSVLSVDLDSKKKLLGRPLDIKGERDLDKIVDLRVTKIGGTKSILSYAKGKNSYIAISKTGLKKWDVVGKIKNSKHVLFLPFTVKKEHFAYCGSDDLRLAKSRDFKKWDILSGPVFAPRRGYFDAEKVWPVSASKTRQGIYLMYFCPKTRALGLALFKATDPSQVIWRTAEPVWVFQEKIKPLGGSINNDVLVFYYLKTNGELCCLRFGAAKVFGEQHPAPLLERFVNNPLISPNPDNEWESRYTFNAAILHEKNKFHFIYRAIGDDGVSVLGYASSKDGVSLDERYPRPVFVAHENPNHGLNTAIRNQVFISGGGWGGCEDPRLTKIDNKVYMTYTSLDNQAGVPQVSLTSIALKSFLSKNWRWSKPVVISPPNEIHKNWVIFPKKINGKYAIMHSMTSKIMIEYLDSLDFKKGEHIISKYLPEYRAKHWDTRVRGVGSPPLETSLGWLIFYHAIDKRDPGKYKLGAMILDRYEPEKILYRSVGPILEPNLDYENTGFKPGIVYNCGAVIVGDLIYVYYGAADTVVCLATAKLKKFLKNLKSSAPAKIDNIFSMSLLATTDV